MAQQQSRVGQQLGHYRLLRPIGSGGFAEVYVGEHVHLRTQAAVKVLHTHLAGADIEDFRREAQTVAFLQHPSIVRVLDFGVEQGIPYLAMDFAPNGSLRQRYPRGTIVPVRELVPLLLQVSSALQYAHDHRLIHRDIKPENMLLGARAEVLLSDFGIALLTPSTHSQSAQNIAGTIAYMAPEQIQAHPRPASDQYALAIVTYEWLCGYPPFQGSYMEIAVKHALTPPPSLRERIPSLPIPVEQVVMRALHKDPQQRFESVHLFAQSFAQVAQAAMQQGLSASYPAPSYPPQYSTSTSANTPTALVGQNRQPPIAAPYSGGLVTPPLSSTPAPVWPSPSMTPQPYNITPAPMMPPQAAWTQPPSLTSYATERAPTSERRPAGLSRRSFLAGGIVGLVAAAGAGTWLYIQQHATGNQAPGLSTPTVSSSPTATAPAGSNTPVVGTTGATTPLLTYSGHQGLVYAISWSPDGSLIVSGSQDGECQVWTADKAKLIFSVHSTVQPAISDDFVQTLAWSSHTPPRVVVGFIEGTIQILDINNRKRLGALTQSYTTNGVLSWSPDEKYLAVCKGITDYAVVIYEVATWNIVQTYQEHTDSVHVVAWSPDGKYVASGSQDTTIRVWNPVNSQTHLVYKEHGGDIAALGWSSDSTKIASTAQDYVVRVWQVSNGNTLQTHTYPQQAPMGKIRWSHNNRYLAVYPGTGSLDILDAQLNIKETIQAGVTYDFSWSPDDTRIATANYNKIAQVWRV